MNAIIVFVGGRKAIKLHRESQRPPVELPLASQDASIHVGDRPFCQSQAVNSQNNRQAGQAQPRLTVTRRGFVLGAGASLVAACSATHGGTAATTTEQGRDPTGPLEPHEPLSASDFNRPATCVLQPEMSAGPFGLEQQFDRQDISEGLPGWPLRLGVRVVDENCQGLPGIAVEVWHADATGDYSAFVDGGTGKDEAGGSTFLRGTQGTNQDGIVEFHTIYPGWYPGRAPHIHLNLRRDSSTFFTTQLFLPDEYSADVYVKKEYSDNGIADTSNADDGLAGDVVTDGTLLRVQDAMTIAGAGTLAVATIGVALPVG